MRDVDQNSLYDPELNTWVRKQDGVSIIGLTDWAQEFVGEVRVISDLPEIGSSISVDEIICTLESDKASTEILSPINGKIIRVNKRLINDPTAINKDCYVKGWLIEIERKSDKSDSKLLTPSEYNAALSTFFNKG